MSELNGDSESSNLQRLNRMEDVIQSMITLVHEQSGAFTLAHQQILDIIKKAATKFKT